VAVFHWVDFAAAALPMCQWSYYVNAGAMLNGSTKAMCDFRHEFNFQDSQLSCMVVDSWTVVAFATDQLLK
jgi:hypothetical protein